MSGSYFSGTERATRLRTVTMFIKVSTDSRFSKETLKELLMNNLAQCGWEPNHPHRVIDPNDDKVTKIHSQSLSP